MREEKSLRGSSREGVILRATFSLGGHVMRNSAIALFAAGVMASAASAQPNGTAYVGSTWGNPSNSVVYLDANMNVLGSFNTGADLPNGAAVGGGYIFTGHFVNQQVRAFDYNGNFQFSWPAPSGLQGLEYVDGNIAVADASSGTIIFYNALTGAQQYSIPSAGATVEGLAYDGKNLFELGDTIDAVDPLTGNVNYSLNNPAINDPFGGTGLAWSAGSLMIGSANGNWYQIDAGNGSLLASGNNGADMYGLGTMRVPAPGAMGLLGVAGIVAGRRRR